MTKKLKLKKIIKSPWIKLFFTILILFLAFRKFDIKTLEGIITHTSFTLLPFLILTNLVTWYLGILAIYSLFHPFKDIQFKRIAFYQLKSMVLGYFTPTQLGEAMIVIYLKKYKISYKTSLTLFFTNKLINFLLILLTGILALYFLKIVSFKLLISLFLIGIIIAIILIFSPLKKFGINYLHKTRPIIYNEVILGYTFFKHNIHSLLFNIGINILKISLTALQVYIAFIMFNIHIPFLQFFTVLNLTRIISLIPISISGLGILEGGMAFTLQKLGYNYIISLSAMSFYRIFTLIMTLFFGLLFFIKKRRIE